MDEKKFIELLRTNEKIVALRQQLLNIEKMMNNPIIINGEGCRIIIEKPNRILSMLLEQTKGELFQMENLFKAL